MINLIKSTFYKEEKTKKKLITFIAKARQLSFGAECEKFERNFAKYQGRKHCIFLNSGSSANLAIIQALLNLGWIKKGDRVGFSAITWSTNVMPLIQLGLKSIPIDVELTTLNISSKQLVNTLKTYPLKALFLTNLLGFCDDIDNIRDICRKRNIILIEDNCESLGSVYRTRKLGNFGMAATFSFYVGHHMSTIEGGCVVTDDEELAMMLAIVRAHGWDRNLTLAKQSEIRTRHHVNSTFYSRYTFYDIGYNLRPTEINGFLGNIQLKYADEIIEKRENNFLKIANVLYKKSDLYYPIKYNHLDLISNFAFPLVCRSKKIRDKLVERCTGKVEIRPIVGGDIASQPFFKKYMRQIAEKSNNFNSRLIHEQGLYFANNPELTKKEIGTLIKIFGE